jgi:Raf kinase inhibitor-like YbhB/YbcL family protein
MQHTQPTSQGRSSRRADVKALTLSSPAFADGAPIPKQFTANGANISPALVWSGAPAGTESFALVCEDPDAPSGLFVHWLVWDIESNQGELGEEVAPNAGMVSQGQNSFENIGYGGPSPPPGEPHRYVFRLYALDTRLELANGTGRAEFDRAIEGHILAEAQLIGMYGR